jgi:hypothetical protein
MCNGCGGCGYSSGADSGANYMSGCSGGSASYMSSTSIGYEGVAPSSNYEMSEPHGLYQ